MFDLLFGELSWQQGACPFDAHAIILTCNFPWLKLTTRPGTTVPLALALHLAAVCGMELTGFIKS
jgi:hypothetical protein